MPVVGHQAISEERDVHAFGHHAEEVDKLLVVFRIAKHLLPGVPPVDHMLNGARFDDATPAWHECVLVASGVSAMAMPIDRRLVTSEN